VSDTGIWNFPPSALTHEGIDLSHPHLVGAGGHGMSAVARLLHQQGSVVSGSDVTPQRMTRLAADGIHAVDGAQALAYAGTASTVVFSSAVDWLHPELLAARHAGVPVLHRAAALQVSTREKSTIAVAGTNGKTTVSAWLTFVLRCLGLDPTYAIGAADLPGGNGYFGNGDLAIVEADESDRSLLALRPHTAIVVSIANDHPETYLSTRDHVRLYAEFAERVAHGGTFVVGVGTLAGCELVEVVSRTRPDLNIVTFGHSSPGSDVRADWWLRNREVRGPGGGHTALGPDAPGDHMLHNAAAVIATCATLGLCPTTAAAVLRRAPTPPRRLSRSRIEGISVVESFAHNPASIAADLDAVEADTLLCLFEPTGFRRVSDQYREIADALRDVDRLLLLPVQGAHRLLGVDSGLILAAMKDTDVEAVVDIREGCRRLAAEARDGDTVVLMGTTDAMAHARECLTECLRLNRA